MADPIGENAYLNLAAPLYGEAEFQQLTTNTILTLQHTTNNAGRFFLGRDFVGSTESSQGDGSSIWNNPGLPYSSVLTDVAVWDIDGAGGYRTLSGTTVLMELNSSGIEGRAGTTLSWSIDSSGRVLGMRQNVVVVTTGANFTIETSLSGSMLYLEGGNATSMAFLLPADAPVGTFYDIYISTQIDVGDVKITSTAGAGRIHMTGTPTSAVSSVDAIQPASTEPHTITLTVMETDIWVASRMGGMNYSSAGTTDYTRADLDLNSWTSAPILA